jgi:hypothetical protein
VADAVRLASQLVAPATAMTRSTALPFPDGVAVVTLEPLSFARSSDGAIALASGWAEPESWGAWSVERECRLRLRIEVPATARKARLGLRIRTVQLADGEPRLVECLLGARKLKRWRLGSAGHRGELVITVPAADLDGPVDLRFLNLNARSPREMAIGDDHRPLGIGVEEIRLLP